MVYRSLTPGSHCYAEFLQRLGSGHACLARVSLTQTGTALAGTLEGVHIPSECRFTGTLSGTAASHTVEGQWNNGRITGAHRVTWDTFDPDTGVARGRLEITGSIPPVRRTMPSATLP